MLSFGDCRAKTARRKKHDFHTCCTDVVFSDTVLEKIFPTLARVVTHLSIPFDMVSSTHVHRLMSSETSHIKAVHMYGRPEQDNALPFWNKAYNIKRSDRLTEIALQGSLIKGVFRKFECSVLSPIRKLDLHGVKFYNTAAVEHFMWPLVHYLKDLTLRDVSIDGSSNPFYIPILSIAGDKLYSLTIDCPVPRIGIKSEASEMLKLLPHIEELNMEQSSHIEWSAVAVFPASLKYLSLSHVNASLVLSVVQAASHAWHRAA